MPEVELIYGDLAPGDKRSAGADFSSLTFHRVQRIEDPFLEVGYDRLLKEFGPLNEMESRDVIDRRLQWHPGKRVGENWLLYEMVVVMRERELMAVRDHVAIVSKGEDGPIAVVHLSHVVVEPEWRRTGLAAYLRAIPIQTARACLTAAGEDLRTPIFLVAEMEHATTDLDARKVRLMAYEKAGFHKADPSRVGYLQPDFRSPQEIDSSGGPKPLPFALIVRRVGNESEAEVLPLRLGRLIRSLYAMYATGIRSSDMSVVWPVLNSIESLRDPIPWVRPSS